MADNFGARHIIVSGRVQGVGFRPFVSRLAQTQGLSGWVLNRAGQVELRVQGPLSLLTAFESDLIDRAPPLAMPSLTESRAVAYEDTLSGFEILASIEGDARQAHIPPDFFMCDDCLTEMRDAAQRRYRYPFINCTQCGPRYTLIERLPYDRPNTCMAGFVLCAECLDDYQNSHDRRFHAQPLACPKCGPGLTYRQPDCADIKDNEAALAACINTLREGLIVCVKGIGGHLLCDARSERAVSRLRQRKQRPDKPLALLLPWQGADGLNAVRLYAEPVAAELDLLGAPLRPIVLVKKRSNSGLAEAIAPGMAEIGLMLPYSPLHHLLLDAFSGPLVATSANIGGEPVLTEVIEVEVRLGLVADAFLHHNRPILRPADDAVFRRIDGDMRPLRLGRGCAPLELTLPAPLEQPLLAVGAQTKNTVALAFDRRVVISPHIGDLGSHLSQQVFEQVIADLSRLYGVDIEQIVCDAHPDYRSSRWAKQSIWPLRQVLHHHAHASALAGEYALKQPMLVFTWDGTGYGEQGALWGGESLLGSPGNWRRVASFRPFRLPGGDLAGREPWRCALALLWELDRSWEACPMDSTLLRQAWLARLNTPLSRSVGRLFDAAATLLGLVNKASYEGQAAMELEAVSEDFSGEPVKLPLLRQTDGLWQSDWAPLLTMLCEQSVPVPIRGGCFHASLAQNLLEQARVIRQEWGIDDIGLTGGVFQNRLLTEAAMRLLRADNFTVYLPERLPANDAAISFGQIIETLAVSRLHSEV